MSDHLEHRCAYRPSGVLEPCDAEAQPRIEAFANMIAAGDYANAEKMADNIARVVETHLAEQKMREGGR